MRLLRQPRSGDRRTRRLQHKILVPHVGRVRLSAVVLLISREPDRTNCLINSLSDLSEGALTVLCVNSLSEATQRLDLNDSIDAAILDCDLPAASDFESLFALSDAAPHLPIIVLGGDRSILQIMNLVEHGAQDYLNKRQLNAETLVSVVYIAIARKYRNRIPFCDQARAQTVLRNISDNLLRTDGGLLAS